MSDIKIDIPDITVVVNSGETYGVYVTDPQVVTTAESNYFSVADFAYLAATASYVDGLNLTTDWDNVSDKPAGLVSSSTQVVEYINTTPIAPVAVTSSVQSPSIQIQSETSNVHLSASVVSGVYNETRVINPSIFTNQFSGASVEYVAQRVGSVRTGIIMGSWSGSSITYTDISNTDVGDTTDLSFNFAKVGNEIRLRAFSSGSGVGSWTIQCLFKLFPNLL